MVSANANQRAQDRFDCSVLKIEYTFDNSIFYDSTDETLYPQEFNLISSDTGPLTWLVGAYANKDEFIVLPGNLYFGVPGGAATLYSFDGSMPSR